MKNVLSLKTLCKGTGGDIGGSQGSDIIPTLSNIDDIFRLFRKRGIKEVGVDMDEMFMIVMFMIANSGGEREKRNWDVFRVLQEGKVDKFLGVKLRLIK